MKKIIAALLTICLLCSLLPAALAEGAQSEYGIMLGTEGVTSGYETLDEQAHSVGAHTVNRTYVFAFQTEDFTVTNETGARISSSGIVLIGGGAPSVGSFPKGGTRDAAYLSGTAGARFTDNAALTAAGYTALDTDATAYYYLYFTAADYAILIQITPNGAVNPLITTREALGEQIARVTGENEANWLQSGDRYNGVSVSANGFWADMQSVLAQAQDVYGNAEATLEELSAAVSALEQAVDALIPADRVNPTALYEAYQAELAEARYQSSYSEQSWAGYAAAMENAAAILGNLFEDGALLPASEQSTLDAAEQALNDAVAALFSFFDYQYAASARPLLPALIAEAGRAQEADYTPESWAVFADALSAAEAAAANTEELTGTAADKVYREAFDALYDAYYWGLVPVGEITVHLTVQDSKFASMRTANQPLMFGADETVTLSGSYTLEDAAAQLGVYFYEGTKLYRDGYIFAGIGVGDRARVYINDIYVTNGSVNPYYNPDPNNKELISNACDLTMHPGDRVVLTNNASPKSNMGANIYQDGASFYQYIDSLYTSGFQTGDDGIITAHAGEKFTVTLNKTTGALGSSGVTSAADNMTLFASSVQEEMGGNTRPERMKNSGELIVTDENGQATVTLYEEGWVLLAAYDLREDVLGDYDSVGGTYITEGTYYSMNTGAAVWVHVLSSEDLDAVKAALQAELDEVYNSCDQTIFPDDELEQLHSLYQTATEGIAAAETTGAARSAQQTGIVAIQNLLKNVINDNARKLSTFRSCLAQLPDDVNLITAAQQEIVDTLIATYESMSDYLKSQLTAGEIEKYLLVAALGELPAAVNYNVNVVVQADTDEAAAALQDMTEWLSENAMREDSYENGWELNVGDYLERYATPFTIVNGERLYAIPYAPNSGIKLNLSVEYSAYYHIRNNLPHTVEGSGWSIVDDPDGGISFVPRFYMNYNIGGRFAVMVGDSEYEVKSISIDGVEDYTESGFVSILDRTSYKDKDYDWVNLWFPDGLYSFLMPYNDVTVTVTWGPAHDARAEAIEALTEHYNSFVRGNYTVENWAELAELYQAGIAAIRTAADPEATKDSYIALMDAVETTGAQTLLGSVSVTVSNNTMADGPFYDETEPFVNETIGLYDTDTMMTVALRALEENGFTYEGTGGSGNGISYLASVTLGVDTLSEKMPGYGGSGWMGMLNNWFVNESLQNFSVQNGMLKNGDKVELVFTCDMGLDVRAGVEGIQDTSMLTITSDAGTLSPVFDAETEEYILALPEGQETARVFFEPQWRCFQARAYKGSYTPAAENYYSSGDMMYLTNGDVIYVAAGDPAWPSMSGNDGVALTASVYRIRVITPEAINEVENLISALKTVKYDNYQSVRGSVENARAAYDALSEEAKAQINPALYEKLTTAERLIAEYTAADEFKAELAAVDVSTADVETARRIVNAYDAMTDAQKAVMTLAEVNKIEALREIAGSAPTVLYGDANGDGKIDAKDVILLRQYIAKYDVTLDLDAADVNADGKIDAKDVILLRQYIAKYDVHLGPQS